MNKYIFIITLAFLAVSCHRKSPYAGYSKAKHNIYFQLHKIGEDAKKPFAGDYVTADIQYKTMNDSIFFSGRRKVQIKKPAYKGAIDECFQMLSKEDAATFIINVNDFFTLTLQAEIPSFLANSEKMKITIEVLEIQTEEEYYKEKEAFLNWIEDFGEYEKVILKQYLADEKIPIKPDKTGIYLLPVVKGTGKKIEAGDTITIDYEGKFLNGKYFDSTVKRNQPFQFVYGTEWQIIEGLETAVGMMHEGDKSIVILPSEMAFGSEGSSTGIIPPFTSLIFVLEILKVN